ELSALRSTDPSGRGAVRRDPARARPRARGASGTAGRSVRRGGHQRDRVPGRSPGTGRACLGATSVLVDIAPPESPALRAAFDHVIAGDAHEVLPEWERRVNGRSGGSFLDPF